MSDWASIIGDYKGLAGNPIKTLLGKSLYLTILKYFDHLIEGLEQDEDTFYMYERLAAVIGSERKARTKGETKPAKPTFRKTKKSKVLDEETGKYVIVESEVNSALMKFANISVDVKNGLLFMLLKYVHECRQCYINGGNSFKSEDEVLNQVVEFSNTTIANPIAPAIIKIPVRYDIDHVIDGNYANILQTLCEKLRPIFKNEEDRAPEKQLNRIVDAFVKYMKIIAVRTTASLFENRQAVNEKFMFALLRNFNLDARMFKIPDCILTEEFIFTMKEYIELKRKAEKAEKTEGEKPRKKAAKPKAKAKPTTETTDDVFQEDPDDPAEDDKYQDEPNYLADDTAPAEEDEEQVDDY